MIDPMPAVAVSIGLPARALKWHKLKPLSTPGSETEGVAARSTGPCYPVQAWQGLQWPRPPRRECELLKPRIRYPSGRVVRDFAIRFPMGSESRCGRRRPDKAAEKSAGSGGR